ncbi:MAG: hypothetical protein JWN96_2451 [Mycobacterium sp.]|nr:hypothetical protein [Mycobacterium sp.]
MPWTGKHAAYGGFLRDRPLAQPVSTQASWQLDNYKKERKTAASAGLDGFTVDVLSVTPGDYNWERLKLLVQAADESDPGFKMVMMPDATQADAHDPNQLAAAMAEMAKHPSAYHLPDGRLVVSPFDPERQGAAWWQSWIKLMHDKYGSQWPSCRVSGTTGQRGGVCTVLLRALGLGLPQSHG